MRPTIHLRPVGAPPAAGPIPLAALRLRRSLAWPVGQAEVVLSPAVEPPEAGAKLQISGASGSGQARPLFTGRLLRRQVGSWGTRLLIEEATGPLARLHTDRAVRSTTAAKLISELCQEAGVPAVVEPPGATLPAYALHFGPSGMDHILRLAAISGLLVRTDTAGQLRVESPLPTPVATLRREDPVIDYQAEDGPDDPPGTRLTGDGAMGARGPGAESWLLQSLEAVAAGDGSHSRHMPGLKTAADVTRAAATLALRAKESSHRRHLVLAGLPPADLGEALLLTGFSPAPEPVRLAGITIVWDAQAGLVTRLELNRIGV
ncbi:MAG: hypothetical protein ACOY93_13795 [Bacillota bacterium]